MARLLAACTAVALAAVLAWLVVKVNAPHPLTPPTPQSGPGTWSGVPLIAPPLGRERTP